MRKNALSCVAVATLLAACSDSLLPVEKTITIEVRATGTGNGRVVADEAVVGINCRFSGAQANTCQSSFKDAGGGGRFELLATPDPGSVFESWTGCASVNGPVCVVTFEVGGPSETITVRANFRLLAGAFGINLLINPSFDDPVFVAALPGQTGRWQGDSAAAIVAPAAVGPVAGARVLQFITTGIGAASANGLSSQQWQIVDVSSIAAAIDSSKVQAAASARFFRVTGDASTDNLFDLRMNAHRGVPAEFPSNYAIPTGTRIVEVTMPTLVPAATWTTVQRAFTLPVGTRYIAVEIHAFENITNDATSPEFLGHYADDISLVLTRLP